MQKREANRETCDMDGIKNADDRRCARRVNASVFADVSILDGGHVLIIGEITAQDLRLLPLDMLNNVAQLVQAGDFKITR